MSLFIRDGLTLTDTIPADPAGRWPAVTWCYRPCRWEDREDVYGAARTADRAAKIRKLVLDRFVSWDYEEHGEIVGLSDALLRDLEPQVFQHMADRVLGFAGPSAGNNGEAGRGKG